MARGRSSNTAVKDPPKVRGGGVWRPTEVQREYRDLLDNAKAEPQTIQDSDGSLLVIELKEISDFGRQITERLRQAAQFQHSYAMHRDQEPAGWVAQTPFPWLASFDRDEVAEFAQELISYTLDAANRGDLEHLEGNLAAWRSTAEVYEDPAALEALTASIDPDEIVEVFPPSEEQVREAEGGQS